MSCLRNSCFCSSFADYLGPFAPGASTLQPVIVHAVLGEDGKVLDAELMENSDTALSKSALALVKRSTYMPVRDRTQLQREAFINVKFISE